ncbi:MAG: NAD(+)/NADH kinase [Oscillospiraceae bacterium]|jgi:NAD+ kinase
MRVVLSPNPYRDKGLRAAQAARKILGGNGVDTLICLPFELEENSRLELPKHLEYIPLKEGLAQADILVCFGGDGTILHAAKDANAYEMPILGVNMGSVGFMAELENGELSQLSKLAQGKYTIEARMMLDVKVDRGGRTIFQDVALNDAVVTKGAVARVIDLAVYGDRVLISELAGDGVILSTPTGSTGYAMSAGGPIVEPTAENIIFTPICAHSLHAKAVVLGSERLISVRLGKDSRKSAYLSVDGGRAFKLTAGDRVEVAKARSQTKLVKLTGRSFYEVLNHKLGRV